MISLEEVKHVATLARIDFSVEEFKQLQKELCSILDYIDKLKEVDVKEIKPTSHSLLIKNVLREDKAKLGSVPNSRNLIDLAPSRKKSFIKVKSVFQK